jgi:hypothetical protein
MKMTRENVEFSAAKIQNDAVKERMKGTFSRPMGEDRYGKTYGVD